MLKNTFSASLHLIVGVLIHLGIFGCSTGVEPSPSASLGG